jgi:hypothetical protein
MEQEDQVTQDLQVAEQQFLQQNQGQSPPIEWKTWRQVYGQQNNPQFQKRGQEDQSSLLSLLHGVQECAPGTVQNCL